MIKNLKKTIPETIEVILGLLTIAGGIAYPVTGYPVFLLVIFICGYVLAPLLFAVVDFLEKRINPGLENFATVPIYYLLSSWHELLIIFIMLPGIAITIVMGPISAILFVASGSCLGVGLVQFLTGSRMGLSDMNAPDMLIITGSTFLITASMIYIVFVRNINFGEKLTFWIDDRFQELLDSMENRIFIRKRSRIGQGSRDHSDEKSIRD